MVGKTEEEASVQGWIQAKAEVIISLNAMPRIPGIDRVRAHHRVLLE